MEMDYTRKFSIQNDKDRIVGYILSEDPTYITNYNNARALIRKLDRDELLQELVKQYLRD